jgi:hypothetical protein
MCPKLDSTLKSFPRNFSMVLDFAGYSTMNKLFEILVFFQGTNVYEKKLYLLI